MYSAKWIEFLGEMYKNLDEQQCVYLVMIQNAIPYILHPQWVDRETYQEEGQTESLISVFTKERDAEEYGEMIQEIFEKDCDIKLNVTRLYVNELWDRLEEFEALSQGDFGCPVRIELCESYDDPEEPYVMVGSDVLYSSLRLLN